MTRNAITLALCMIACLSFAVLAGCQPAAPEANRNATATAQPTKEPFNPAAIEAEVVKLEKEWARALTTRDVDAYRRIEADDIVLTYPDGITGTKADDIRDIESGALTVESYEVVETKVKVLNAESAVVTGRSVMKNGIYKRPKARPIDISGEYRFTDVFARRNGVWQIVASQATKIDPDAAQAVANAAQASPSPTPSPSPTTSRTP